MIAYSKNLYPEIMDLQGDLFYCIRGKLPGVDETWFINNFMKSQIRSYLDKGNFKYAYYSHNAVLNYFLCEMNNCDISHGEFIPADYKRAESNSLSCGDLMWIGMMYSYYQWRTGISSAELIDRLTLRDMVRIYPALHQMGWEAGANKIHKNVLNIGELDGIK